ncbi:MAG: arginine--tRNA ligase [Verrucomicrobiota bacterium]
MQIAFDSVSYLSQVVTEAAGLTGAFDASFTPEVRAAEPRFGDYQANGVLPYAKRNKTNPRALATQLLEKLQSLPPFADGQATADIAGPGFLNIRLAPAYKFSWLKAFRDESSYASGARKLLAGKTVVVDYPSPNTAKQMHIGHLRPMVIGEAVARLIAFCGAKVIKDNHLGDWGTNFGTLIMAIKREGFDLTAAGEEALPEIERLYKAGTALEKEDPAVRDISRAELKKLQQGDPENTDLWEQIVAVSNRAFEKVYANLDLTPDITLGESFYRDKVDRIYDELTACGLAQESDGALVVFHPEHPRFAEQPFIIRKADGASNYASTDLATLLYRREEFAADEVVYLTDGRQRDHFEQLFLTAQKWFEKQGYTLPKLTHVWWGTILGEDGKAIKTRSGEPIYLAALLDEAIERARAIVDEKSPDLTEQEKAAIATAVGLGAVRYADLSQNRTQDYVFAWDKLLAFEGNSAPYLLMAVARVHSIFRKAGVDLTAIDFEAEASVLETEEELALARKLMNFPEAITLAVSDLRPHHLCTYLYELAGDFSTFFNANRVIVDEADVKARRLMLCARTVKTLETGLHLLGITPLERM